MGRPGPRSSAVPAQPAGWRRPWLPCATAWNRWFIETIPEARTTVPATTPRAPHIASLLLPGLPAEPLLHALEARGVYASAGAACSTRAHGPSHVLAAIGIGERDAVLRFSLSRLTTESDVKVAALALREAVDEIASVVKLRRRDSKP
jgi:cysteine desulfurase